MNLQHLLIGAGIGFLLSKSNLLKNLPGIGSHPVPEDFQDNMEDILRFARSRGYDLNNLTREMLDDIMRAWLHHTRKFYEEFEQIPFPAQKSFLNLD